MRYLLILLLCLTSAVVHDSLRQQILDVIEQLRAIAEQLPDEHEPVDPTDPDPPIDPEVKLWSDPASWPDGIPTAETDVTLTADTIIDGVAHCRALRIEGTATLAGTLHAHGSVIVEDGGKLQGTAGDIQFYVETDRVNLGAHGVIPDPVDIGLWCMPGGEIDLRGEPKSGWLSTSGFGSPRQLKYGLVATHSILGGTAKLVIEPTGWTPGDDILLTNEEGSSVLTKLTGVNGDTVTFEDTTFSGSELTYEGEVVGSAKVANLTRSITINSALCVEGDTNHRAHTIALRGAKIHYERVEFRNLGPRGILGEYPVHIHHALDQTPAVVYGCSVWQDCGEPGNRMYVIHNSNGVELRSNIGYLCRGHGFFMEEGNEHDCIVEWNLAVEASGREEIPVHSPAGSRINFAHAYWVWADNTFRNNVSVGRKHGWQTRATFPTVGFVVKDHTNALDHHAALDDGTFFVDHHYDKNRVAGPPGRVEDHEHYGGHSAGWSDDKVDIVRLKSFNADFGLHPSFPTDYQRIEDSLIYGSVGLSGYAYRGHIATNTTFLTDTALSTQGNTLIRLDDCRVRSLTLVKPETWQIGVLFSECDIVTGRAIQPITFARNQHYSLIRIRDSQASIQGLSFTDADFASARDHIPAHGFEGQNIGGDDWLLDNPAPDGGLITIAPHHKGFVSVTPEGHEERPPTSVPLNRFFASADSMEWGLGGYFGRYPPGKYRVKVYANATSETPAYDEEVEVVAGETVAISSGL